MTQEEVIAEGFEAICKQLEKLNAKFERLIELLSEGLTVYEEPIDEKAEK